MSEKNQIRLTGLWAKTLPDGTQILSGSLGGTLNLNVYPNKFKRGPSDPDFNLVLSEKPKQQEAQRQPAQQFIQNMPTFNAQPSQSFDDVF